MASADVVNPQVESLCDRLKKKPASNETVSMIDVSEILRPEKVKKSIDQFRIYETNPVSDL